MIVTYDFSKPIGEMDFSNNWEGTIQIEMPKASQRFKYISEIGLGVGSNSEITISSENLASMSKLMEIASNHVKKVEVIHKETETVFTSYEEMEYYSECNDIISFIAGQVINGARLGKK